MRWLVAILIIVSGMAFARSTINEMPALKANGEFSFTFDAAFRKHVRDQFDEAAYNDLINEALDQKDTPLAKSYADLAGDVGYKVDPEIEARLDQAKEIGVDWVEVLRACATGETDSPAQLVGTLACDLIVIGDIRDTFNETSKLLSGEQPDELILGLSLFGLASSVATLQSGGGFAAADLGASFVKNGKRAKKITPEFERLVVSQLDGVIDPQRLKALGDAIGEVNRNVFSIEFGSKFLVSITKGAPNPALITDVIKPISKEISDYDIYLRSLPIAGTVKKLSEVNASLIPAGQAWDKSLRAAHESMQLMGDMPSAGRKIIPGIKSADDLEELVQFTKRYKTKSRGAAKLLGAKSLRSLKVTYKLWEYLVEELRALMILIASILSAIIWLAMSGKFERRMRKGAQ